MDGQFFVPSLSTKTNFNFLRGTLYAVSGLQAAQEKRGVSSFSF
jgi:hypothetical protein